MLFPEPNEVDRVAAKLPHNIFLWNLIGNHILTFVAIASMGSGYVELLLFVPVFSILTLVYTAYRARKVVKQDNEFVWAHWQIAQQWSRRFSVMVSFLLVVSIFGWLGQAYMGFKPEMVYGLIGGIGLLPTLIMVLVLIIIESDALNYANKGLLPKSAEKRLLADNDDAS